MARRLLAVLASSLLSGCLGTVSATDAGVEPCEVNTLLWTHCVGCHSEVGPGDGVFTSLEALRATPPDGGTQTWAERAVVRLHEPVFTMPPLGVPKLTPAEIALFTAWVEEGAKAKTCAPPPLRSFGLPTDGGVSCSSGIFWNNPADRSGAVVASHTGDGKMFPGRACIVCHDDFIARGQDAGFDLWVGGTVYPTAHEANDCAGFPGPPSAGELPDLRVRITDANGVVYTRPVNSSGGFGVWPSIAPNFKFPYTAAVLYQGRERRMSASQMNGDCNLCHTVFGAENAPGRIVIP